MSAEPRIIHGYLQLAKRSAEAAPYTIRPCPGGVAVWTKPGGRKPIATFVSRDDAEEFVFLKAGPIWDDWS